MSDYFECLGKEQFREGLFSDRSQRDKRVLFSKLYGAFQGEYEDSVDILEKYASFFVEDSNIDVSSIKCARKGLVEVIRKESLRSPEKLNFLGSIALDKKLDVDFDFPEQLNEILSIYSSVIRDELEVSKEKYRFEDGEYDQENLVSEINELGSMYAKDLLLSKVDFATSDIPEKLTYKVQNMILKEFGRVYNQIVDEVFHDNDEIVRKIFTSEEIIGHEESLYVHSNLND